LFHLIKSHHKFLQLYQHVNNFKGKYLKLVVLTGSVLLRHYKIGTGYEYRLKT